MIVRRFSDWKTRLSLKPGQQGTKEPYEKFGDRLVCVRYRYNAERNRRIKTVEIVIEEIPWRTEASEKQKKAKQATGGQKPRQKAAQQVSAKKVERPARSEKLNGGDRNAQNRR